MNIETSSFGTPPTRLPEKGSADTAESKMKPKDVDFEEKVRAEIAMTFDTFDDREEGMMTMREGVKDLFRHLNTEIVPAGLPAEIDAGLNACSQIGDRDLFIGSVLSALRPVLELKTAYPAEFEDARAGRILEEGDNIALNRLVTYGKAGSTIHIHHLPGETVGNKKGLYLDAMRKLADIVQADPDVRNITATSWIVADHPRMFELNGFEVAEVPADIREEHFGEETRDIRMATIGREEFLKRFLKDDVSSASEAEITE